MAACFVLTLALAASAPAAAAAHGSPPTHLTSAQLLQYVRSVSNATLIPQYCDASSSRVKWDVGHASMWGECAALQAQLFVHSGGDKAAANRLAAGAVSDIRRLVEQVNQTKTADFFTSPSLMLAFAALKRAGVLSAADEAAVRTYATKTFKPAVPADSNNQHYQRAVGLELAAQAFPDAPQATVWQEYAEDVWSLVDALGDITEDAPNYNRIDLTYLWVLADLLGKTERLRAPSFHAMFARFSAQVSPSGVLPSYGDSGASQKLTTHNFSNVPWSNPWGGFVAGFVRAASEWQDAELSDTASLMFASGVSSQPLGGVYGDVSEMFRLALAIDWFNRQPVRSMASVPRVDAAPSAVLTRPDSNGVDRFDKVVLRSNNRSDTGGAFLLSDLFASEVPVPPHAHENQHGQVNWFEYAGVPLVSSLGYDNRGPADTNLLLLRRANSSFPHRIPKFDANTWEHATLPTRRMGSGRVSISQLTLRIEWDGKPISFSAAEFSLHGPSGKRALNLFDDPAMWQYPRGASVSKQNVSLPGDDGRRSVSALVWSLPSGKSGQAGAQFIVHRMEQPLTFQAEDFPEIHVDWRISSNSDVTRTFILRVASSPNAVDYHASELNLAPILQSATVDTTGDDAVAQLAYTQWFGYDMSLNRSMILAGPEGVLLVRDVLDIGTAAVETGMQAGPIWHFGPVAQPVVGGSDARGALSSSGGSSDKWVLSQNASVNLCVVFNYKHDAGRSDGRVPMIPATSDLQVGFQTADVWSKSGQQSAYANTKLLSAGRHSFVSLLVPVRVSDLPSQHTYGFTEDRMLRSFETDLVQTATGVVATVRWPRSMCVSSSTYCGTTVEIALNDTIVGGCGSALQRACAMQRTDVLNCAQCTGGHQSSLHKAGCDNSDIATWCRSSNDLWLVKRRPLAPIAHTPP